MRLTTDQSDNHASTISAWITPTNTGFYEFFVNGDDETRLYLNPNGPDPAGAVWIGDRADGSTVFKDYNIITHYPLTNGQSYFLQLVSLEGGGADQCRAGWRYLGTIDQAYDGTGANGAWIVEAANLPPIEGKFLSSYSIAAPVISVQPISSIVAPAGTATNLFVVVSSTGTGTTNYQWQRSNAGANSFSDVSGKTAAINTFSSLAYADYGDWRVKVDDGTLVAPVFSSVATVRPPAFSITPLPTPAVAPQGAKHLIQVTSTAASGSTFYQWRFNGLNLVNNANYANATANPLVINNYQAPRFGNYDVVVSDGYASRTSTVQTLSGFAGLPSVSVSRSGANLDLSFPTELGPSYILEYRNVMSNGAPWFIYSTNVGNGSINLISVPTTNAQQYLRIRMQ